MNVDPRPDWLKPAYNMHVLVNKSDLKFDMGTADNTFAEMLSAIGELIERNPDASSWVFTVVNKQLIPDPDQA